MSEFHATLLREKFVIHDAMPGDMSDKEPVVALSNRLELPFKGIHENSHETFIVRAQNMHTCTRLGAKIAQSFSEEGPLMNRHAPFDWRYAYLSITKGYEKTWNPNRWVAVYHNGRVIFEDGEVNRHPFLDIIEQCEARNKGDYEHALAVAEDAFKQAGKLVTIKHDSNVALIMGITPEEGKCGVILRGPNKTTTFNLTARKKADRVVKISQCMSVAAAFLEGIQLAFLIGMTNMKEHYELIENTSDEAKQAKEASQKLGRLNSAVTQFENLLDVSYRPERPNMGKMIDEAEEFARKILASEIEKRILLGDDDSDDWVV